MEYYDRGKTGNYTIIMISSNGFINFQKQKKNCIHQIKSRKMNEKNR